MRGTLHRITWFLACRPRGESSPFRPGTHASTINIISVWETDPDFSHPDPFHETDQELDPGSKKLSKIMDFHKNQPKGQIYYHISYVSFKNITLLFNEHKYLPHKKMFRRNMFFSILGRIRS